MVVAKIMDRYVHIPLDLVTKKRRKLDIRSGLWRAVLESTGQGELTGMVARRRKSVTFRVLHALTRSTAQADPRFGGFGQGPMN